MLGALVKIAFVVFTLSLVSPASAADLKQTGDHYWIALASRQTADEAIAIARRYTALHPSVVSSINGWYAVVVGPRSVPQGLGKTTLEALVKSDFIPSDAYLTRGEGYAALVWRMSASPMLASSKYDGTTDAVLQSGALRVVLSSVPVDGEDRAPVATGSYDGKPAFAMVVGKENPNPKPASEAITIRLDHSSPEPQVVLTYFWQGAHCCTITRIASMHPDGTWKLIDGETLDGEEGYHFEDITGSGQIDLTSTDQAFPYTFASYAASVSPTRIHRLEADRLVDVTREPRYYEFLKQQLAGIESGVKPDDPVWHDNGFLAGWVAAKMLVGQGVDAWSKMLTGYDRSPDFGPETCAIDRPVDSCPDAKKIRTAFPIALKAFLVERGYILNASLYPTPPQDFTPEAPVISAPAMPSSLPPALQQCTDSSDTARKLIYQMFVGRKLQSGETYDLVRLEGDTTLEASDSGIGRIVCAVTYDLNLKSLVGRLAENGEFGRAEALGRLMRRSGTMASTRVQYSVKQTATPGTSYVELLR